MARNCTICEHPNRDEIDHLIINGNTFRDIALQYDSSHHSVTRQKDAHLSKMKGCKTGKITSDIEIDRRQ